MKDENDQGAELAAAGNDTGRSETEPASGLPRDEWLRRYKQRFVDVAALTPDAAQSCADAESFEVLSDSFEDDPEGAADSEMSYWDGE